MHDRSDSGQAPGVGGPTESTAQSRALHASPGSAGFGILVAEMLVKHGVVDHDAVHCAEDYDNGATLGYITDFVSDLALILGETNPDGFPTWLDGIPRQSGAYWLHPDGWYRLYPPNIQDKTRRREHQKTFTSMTKENTPETQESGTVPPLSVAPGSAPATRDQAVRALLEEVMWWHSDSTLPHYNGCDTDPCMWCESAKSLLAGTANYAEIGKIRPND